MNRSCCIKSCGRSRKHDKMRIFAFPRASSLIGRIWREKCNIPQEIYHKRPRICELHFDKKDIGNKFLKRTAVPKYFLNQISDDNEDGNDRPVKEDSTYDWKSLDEVMQEEKDAHEPEEELPTAIETVIETVLVERCNNCDKKNKLALCYKKKCNSLINDNHQLKILLEEKSKMLSAQSSEYKNQTEDLLNESLRNLERSKYYEKKCDALKEKYERIVNQLEKQLKEQSEIARNCLPECSINPELEKQSRNINAMPEPMRSSNLEKPPEKASCTPEPTLSASSSDSPLNANLITEPMQLDNQPNSDPNQNDVNTIKNDYDDVESLLKKEIKDEMDMIKESDSEVDFNFNYDDALMSPSNIKQEEFILE